MRVNKLILYNFRNYKQLDQNFDNNINVLIGRNAQGKTNILEALLLGSLGYSHRSGNDKEFIKWNQENTSIHIEFDRQSIIHTVDLKFNMQNAKQLYYNRFPVKFKEFIGNLNAVMFSPEDLLLIKGAPALRRKFLDSEIAQTNRYYHHQLLKYYRIVQQRNILLKKIREKKAAVHLLDVWNDEFIKYAAEIVSIRQQAIKKLSMLANLMHRKISDHQENLKVSYLLYDGNENINSSIYYELTNLHELYKSKLEQNREIDIIKGSTGIGPHRDDLLFAINGMNLKTYGSQGQQRSGILALKLAEIEFIKAAAGEYPILLLDDVMSELDEVRRQQLLSFIKDRIQTFITATDKNLFLDFKQAVFLQVIDGKVLAMN